MFTPFFVLAAQSPGRQMAFRQAVIGHVVVLGGMVAALTYVQPSPVSEVLLGQLLLVLGIIEGATLLGWRLAQLPKSQAMEFLFVSPLRPRWVFLSEAAVGLARLALVTLASLPLLLVLVAGGLLEPIDLVPMLVLPFTSGALTGLILTVWAYETRGVRRWGERVVGLLILVYLVVGVMAGEKLRLWLMMLPDGIGLPLFQAFHGMHAYNPFGLLRTWQKAGAAEIWQTTLWVELGMLGLLAGLLWRGSARMQGHFQDRHYQPAFVDSKENRGTIADAPLTWWAVRRVTQYSGRVNMWLAGGFALVYAAYILAGAHWPSWMGHSIFAFCDRVAGLGGLATALVVLAAVPAAFQYGLWDANAHERCRRLELLMLTRLQAQDYWNAAARAAWSRGRGYFVVAGILWLTAGLAGRMTLTQVAGSAAVGVLLWSLYFALGFRAFSRGSQANGLGMLLTVGLPLAAFALARLGAPALAGLTPPGSVHAAGQAKDLWWVAGAVLIGASTLWIARLTLSGCEADLRRWYEAHHGRKVMA